MLSSSCSKLSSGEVTLVIVPVRKEWPKKRGKKRRKAAARPLFKTNFVRVTYASVVAQPRDVLLQPPELLGGGPDDALEF